MRLFNRHDKMVKQTFFYTGMDYLLLLDMLSFMYGEDKYKMSVPQVYSMVTSPKLDDPRSKALLELYNVRHFKY